MAATDFELVKHVGKFDIGPLRSIHGRWQRVHGRLRADVRAFAEKDDGTAVATRSGLSLPPEQLNDLAGLVQALQDSQDEVLDRSVPDEAETPVQPVATDARGDSGG